MALSHQGESASRRKEALRLAAAHDYYRSQIRDMFAPTEDSSDLDVDGSSVRASVRGGAEGRSSVPTGAPRYTDDFYDSLEQLALSGMALAHFACLPSSAEEIALEQLDRDARPGD